MRVSIWIARYYIYLPNLRGTKGNEFFTRWSIRPDNVPYSTRISSIVFWCPTNYVLIEMLDVFIGYRVHALNIAFTIVNNHAIEYYNSWKPIYYGKHWTVCIKGRSQERTQVLGLFSLFSNRNYEFLINGNKKFIRK